jgi:glycosyltransferase involved in cell wall biosynthesis
VPCHDLGAYLPEAVESLVTQAGGPPRVVVVDDGSSDPATLRALDELPADIRVIRQANAGVCAARNAGLRAADSPLLLCLDADDRLAPRALQILRRALQEHPDAGFAYGLSEFFGAWSGVLRIPPYDPLRLLDRSLVSVTALVRREVIADTGGFDPDFTAFEDWELWLHALARGWRGVRVDEVTLLYRRLGDSKLAGDRRRYRAMRRALRAKHADLFARRRELARTSDLGAGGRLAYRLWWGPRPLPARVEAALYDRVFGTRPGRG